MPDRHLGHCDQSGVIPYRLGAAGLEILLITSHSGRRWIFPKGWIAPGEAPRASAAREAFEEAGIEGRIHHAPLGSYVYRKNGREHVVAVYLLEVIRAHTRWPEDRLRKRRWMPLARAMDRAADGALKRLLHRVAELSPAAQPA